MKFEKNASVGWLGRVFPEGDAKLGDLTALTLRISREIRVWPFRKSWVLEKYAISRASFSRITYFLVKFALPLPEF